MIKVLHIIDKLSMDGLNPSSCTVLMGDWFEHMDHENFDMSVCTLRNPDPAGSYLEEKGVKVSYLGYGKLSPANILGIARLIDSEKADVVHLHGYSAANFGRIASWLKNVPNIVHEHAVLQVQPHQYVADRVLSKLTDLAVAVSGNVRDFMIESRSVAEGRIRVIGNGIQLERYSGLNGSVRDGKRHEIGLSDDVKIVGTVTRLREEKGNEYLIRAVPAILEKEKRFVLLVVGDGPLRNKLEGLVRDLGVEPYVKFLGFRKDVPELLSIFDIQVIPSLTEGFPLCMAEAMAAGNAVVATEVGGMKEIGRDGKTVLFVSPRSPDELAEKVTYLLANDDAAKAMSANAVEYSKAFGIGHSVSALQSEYEQLVNSCRR